MSKTKYLRCMKKFIVALLLIVLIFALFLQRKYLYQLMAAKNFIQNDIASEQYVKSITSQNGNYAPSSTAIFLNKKFAPPADETLAQNTTVLGDSTPSDDSRWIEVDISEQQLYMMENGRIIKNFSVSTGKWYPTPPGQWRIWTKLRFTRMKGGSKALGTYYDLPNVPYTMYYNQGYGIHGAYWHNNFGHPMSHGCVNMRPDEAGIVFNWASIGTRVIVRP